MATEDDVLKWLATQAQGMDLKTAASGVKTDVKSIQTQLKRLGEKGFVTTDTEGWLITDKGRQTIDAGGVPATMIDEKVTPRQQFERIGQFIGVPAGRIELAVNQVMSGPYEDLEYVFRALREVDLATDVARTWTNSWAVKIQRQVPDELRQTMALKKIEEEAHKTGRHRDDSSKSYTIDTDTLFPRYVGEDLGDYTYKDAMELAKIQSGRGKAAAAGAPMNQAEDALKLVRGIAELFAGGGSDKKTVVVSRGPTGAMEVKELEDGGAYIVTEEKKEEKPAATFFLDPKDGQVKAIPAGHPIVIEKPAQEAPKAVTYVFNHQTRQLEQIDPSKPMVIETKAPDTGYSTSPIRMPDGSEMKLGDWLILDKYQREQKRLDDEHKQKQDVMGGFKDFVSKIGLAAARYAGESK